MALEGSVPRHGCVWAKEDLLYLRQRLPKPQTDGPHHEQNLQNGRNTLPRWSHAPIQQAISDEKEQNQRVLQGADRHHWVQRDHHREHIQGAVWTKIRPPLNVLKPTDGQWLIQFLKKAQKLI